MPELLWQGTVDELNRLATDSTAKGADRHGAAEGPRELPQADRAGSYGSFVNYYICELNGG